MNVTICTAMRDEAANVGDYIRRLDALDYPHDQLRFAVCEGDSVDATWRMLQTWCVMDKRVRIVKKDNGTPKYGSIVNPDRFRALARAFNQALAIVDLDWTDYAMFLPADIVYKPDLVKRLVSHGQDVVAAMPWQNGRFYDIWAFSGGGVDWMTLRREAVTADGLLEVQTAGGTMAIHAEVLGAGCRYTEDQVDRGLCEMAQAAGFRVWVDTGAHVEHPPR